MMIAIGVMAGGGLSAKRFMLCTYQLNKAFNHCVSNTVLQGTPG
jgi:hypothetical protein